MRLSRTSIQKAVAGVVVGTGLAVAGSASAGLLYDLRFDDGSHSKIPTPNTTYTLQLWAQVTGADAGALTANTGPANEGFANSFVALKSTQVGGGAMTSGGVMSGTLAHVDNNDLGVIAYAMDNAGRPGTAADLTPDGIGDWGSASTDLANTNYMLARSSVGNQWVVNAAAASGIAGSAGPQLYTDGAVFSRTGDFGHVLPADPTHGYEWRLADFTFQTGATLGPGRTQIKMDVDGIANSVADANVAVYYQDGTGPVSGSGKTRKWSTPASITTGGGTASQPIFDASGFAEFVVPEPGSLGLLGIAAIGLLARRRS
jgi:hypothetical protein